MPKPQIMLTGASGLLGRAIYHILQKSSEWQLTGCAFNRLTDNLQKLDLTNLTAIDAFCDQLQPTVIIHAAAERRPDVSQQDPTGTHRLNIEATERIARWAGAHRAFLIYISSDYVFDGTQPPYAVHAIPNPLSDYGASKLAGEKLTQRYAPDGLILRIPLLYGPVEWLGESPTTMIADEMLAAPGTTPLPIDHWATRYPTHTHDVARVLASIVRHRLQDPHFHGIYHWSGNQAFTKYEMAKVFAPWLGFDPARLIPVTTPGEGAPRPRNSHLDTSRLTTLGIAAYTDFVQAAGDILRPHLPPTHR